MCAAGAELEHAVVLERVRGLDEVGEDRVVRVVLAAFAPERTAREPDDPDQRGPAVALKQLLERARHARERTGRILFRCVAPG